MHNEVIPNVPVLVNTYYPPNAPTALRCYKLGQSLRRAIDAWDSDKTVAIFASGGLSHTVIEEELDEKIIDGLRTNDIAKLNRLPGRPLPGRHVGDQELGSPWLERWRGTGSA